MSPRIEYEYRGFWGCRSRCGLEVIQQQSFVLVIATELEGNPGASVTNMSESLAFAVCQDWGIPARSLVWVEHYPERDVSFSYLPSELLAESWDLVQFYLDQAEGRFSNPRWFRLSEAQMRQLRAGVMPEGLPKPTRNVR